VSVVDFKAPHEIGFASAVAVASPLPFAATHAWRFAAKGAPTADITFAVAHTWRFQEQEFFAPATDLSRRVQSGEVGQIVELFAIDLSYRYKDAPVLRITSSARENDFVRWRGMNWVPLPIDAEGFETVSNGPMPTPTFRISNINLLASGLLVEYGTDLVGVKVTRHRVLRENLDDGLDPNSDAEFQPDIYIIQRKTAQNSVFVEWQLSSILDREGRKIPGRKIVRDYCDHAYRYWDKAAEAFDYARATCPYTEDASFNAAGRAVSVFEDRCGKKLYDCRLRFGARPLPFRGFPGVGRIS